MHATETDRAKITATPEHRSDYGHVPGEEFPRAVYGSVVAAFVFIVAASWVAFGGGGDADLTLGFATVLTIVFFALPILVRRTAAAHSNNKPTKLDEFLGSRVETATGSLTGSQAWLQILIIPLSLAFAALAIGTVFLCVA